MIPHYSNNEWSDDDNDDYFDDIFCYQELSHSQIINRCKFMNGHVINSRHSLGKSLLQQEMTTINSTERQDSTVEGKDLTNLQKI
jgi:hypothetical protein